MRNLLQRYAVRAAFVVPFAAFLGSPSTGWAGPILGSAQSFAVLGYAGVTATGATQIYGNVGVSPLPLTSITGFPPGIVTGGSIFGPASLADQALADINTAAVTLAGLGVTGTLSTNLGGQTLTPGVYSLSGAASLLTGTLTLNAGSAPNALFVFLLPSTLTTASASVVNVINGTAGTEVYWVVGSSAALGSGSTFQGNILAHAGIALDSTAKIECGRAFSETASVTLIGNNISGNCANQNSGTQSDSGSLGFSGGTAGAGLQAIPEPGTLPLLGMGLGAGFLLLRKFRSTR